MTIGDLVLKMNGDPYVDPPTPRQTLQANFTVQVSHVTGSPTLTVDVEHRNAVDTAWAVAGTFPPIAGPGVFSLVVPALEELVRLKYTIAATNSYAGMRVFAPSPQWLID